MASLYHLWFTFSSICAILHTSEFWSLETCLYVLCTFFAYEQFEHDTVLIPKETAWFGYYPDGAFNPVLPAQQVLFLLKKFFSFMFQNPNDADWHAIV